MLNLTPPPPSPRPSPLSPPDRRCAAFRAREHSPALLSGSACTVPARPVARSAASPSSNLEHALVRRARSCSMSAPAYHAHARPRCCRSLCSSSTCQWAAVGAAGRCRRSGRIGRSGRSGRRGRSGRQAFLARDRGRRQRRDGHRTSRHAAQNTRTPPRAPGDRHACARPPTCTATDRQTHARPPPSPLPVPNVLLGRRRRRRPCALTYAARSITRTYQPAPGLVASPPVRSKPLKRRLSLSLALASREGSWAPIYPVTCGRACAR